MAADEAEPRRSGRATKGQYTKDRDILEEGQPKKKGKSKGVKGKEAVEEAEEPEEIIRCVCGQYEDEDGRDMVSCDNCSAWQHNDCMGLSFGADDAPANYYCEQCRPEDHKELLAAMARGEKPWEEVARAREAAEKAKKKKGGKRGRKSGGRPGQAQSEVSQDVEASQTPDKTTPAPTTSGQKRKLDEASPTQVDVKKARSVSVKASSPTESRSESIRKPSVSTSTHEGASVNSAEELSNVQRKSAAKALIKLFTEQAKMAQKDGTYKSSQGQSLAEVGTSLGLDIEHTMYFSLSSGFGDPSDAYKTQLRTIIHNVKSNTTLRDRMLDGDLKPHALAVMNAENMASKEQQQRDAQIKKEAEKQHMIIQDEGPRIRRTHKGEEFVDESQQTAAESIYPTAAPPRRGSQADTDMADAKSPTQMTAAQAEKHLFSSSSRREQPSINTQVRRSAPDRRSSSNINIQDVWSSVHSPDHDNPQFPAVAHRAAPPVQGPGAQPDAEIDELLKDEDNESEPYSPKDVAPDMESVWQGQLDMDPIAGFRCSARFAAGAAAEAVGLTWETLMPQYIGINGRIDTKRADHYLCGLRYSSTTDVVVLSVRAPESPADRQQFDNLFDYFKERDRYGVVAKHAVPAVKDTYVMTVEAGATNDKKPEFLQLLDNDNIPSPNLERLLLIVYVVRFSELSQTSASAQATPRDQPAVSASPIAPAAATTPYQSFNGQPTPYQYSPTTPSSHPPIGNGSNPDVANSPVPYPAHQQMSSAAAAAQQVLPPEMINSPAIQQLLYQAPQIGIREMNVVKDCVRENPAAATDLNVLTSMLIEKQPSVGQ